jgi:centromere protein V
LFCKVCGIKSFYVPRSNPDGYSVNVRCLDSSTVESINISQFDGQNWEQHAAELPRLSSDQK